MANTQIQQGSFRGVKFYISTGLDTTIPKKTKEWNFPNSTKRVVEEMGIELYKFKITMNTYDTGNFDNKNALIKALNQEGAGILIHPTFGERTVKVFEEIGISEDPLENSGVTSFSVTFYEENVKMDVNPLPISDANKTLLGLASSHNIVVAGLAQGLLKLTNSTNFAILKDKIGKFQTIMNTAKKYVDKASSFALDLNEFEVGISSFLLQPSTLAGGLLTIMNSANLNIANPFDRFSLFKSFFNFGNDDVIVVANTLSKQERYNNNLAVNNQVQISAYNYASTSISDIDFQNNDQLQSYKDTLNAQYDAIVASPAFTSGLITEDIFDYLKQTKIAVNQIFDAKVPITPNIIKINLTKSTNINTICYKYYGNLDNVDNLIILNNVQTPCDIIGDFYIYG